MRKKIINEILDLVEEEEMMTDMSKSPDTSNKPEGDQEGEKEINNPDAVEKSWTEKLQEFGIDNVEVRVEAGDDNDCVIEFNDGDVAKTFVFGVTGDSPFVVPVDSDKEIDLSKYNPEIVDGCIDCTNLDWVTREFLDEIFGDYTINKNTGSEETSSGESFKFVKATKINASILEKAKLKAKKKKY